jgi:hypothetical protein
MKQRRVGLVLATAVSLVALAAPGAAVAAGHGQSHAKPYTFAVIGDIPYGPEELAVFPEKVDQINADPDVRMVDHLGDIKSGSTVCSDDYFQQIRSEFDRFRDPLVYTPGDNEWTDCHRTNNGAFNPLERLTALRKTFFSEPNRTLGRRSVSVRSQTRQGFPENVRYTRADVAFAAVHIVGSNNGLGAWTGLEAATPAQTSEVLGRTAAGIELIRETFRSARRHDNRAVVLLTQADMFDPTVEAPAYADYFAFQPIVAAIAQESAAYGGPVYLINGDSHVFNSDKPLGSGAPWPSFYGLTKPVDNLTRITVNGSDMADDYLKVTIASRRTPVLSWVRVPFKTTT